MNKLYGLLLIGLLAMQAARAAEGVLLEYVPPDVTDAVTMDSVKQALVGRKWAVTSGAAGALVAELSEGATDAKVEFFLEGRTVRYREIAVTKDFVSAGIGPANTGTRTPVKAKTTLPERWVSALRQDLSRLLAANRAPQPAPQSAVSGEAAPAPAIAPSIKARLETLKELFDAKLISESEYEQKRQQILKEL